MLIAGKLLLRALLARLARQVLQGLQELLEPPGQLVLKALVDSPVAAEAPVQWVPLEALDPWGKADPWVRVEHQELPGQAGQAEELERWATPARLVRKDRQAPKAPWDREVPKAPWANPALRVLREQLQLALKGA
jgi:hypothetical protein